MVGYSIIRVIWFSCLCSVLPQNCNIFSCRCVGCILDVYVYPQFDWFMIWKSTRESFRLKVSYVGVLDLQQRDDDDSSTLSCYGCCDAIQVACECFQIVFYTYWRSVLIIVRVIKYFLCLVIFFMLCDILDVVAYYG